MILVSADKPNDELTMFERLFYKLFDKPLEPYPDNSPSLQTG